jgi:hypothetical protein
MLIPNIFFIYELYIRRALCCFWIPYPYRIFAVESVWWLGTTPGTITPTVDGIPYKFVAQKHDNLGKVIINNYGVYVITIILYIFLLP